MKILKSILNSSLYLLRKKNYVYNSFNLYLIFSIKEVRYQINQRIKIIDRVIHMKTKPYLFKPYLWYLKKFSISYLFAITRFRMTRHRAGGRRVQRVKFTQAPREKKFWLDISVLGARFLTSMEIHPLSEPLVPALTRQNH